MQKVYVITYHSAYDYEMEDGIIGTYKKISDAKKMFKKSVEKEKETAKDLGWAIGTDSHSCFEAYEEGYYAQNHTCIRIIESTLE